MRLNNFPLFVRQVNNKQLAFGLCIAKMEKNEQEQFNDNKRNGEWIFYDSEENIIKKLFFKSHLLNLILVQQINY